MTIRSKEPVPRRNKPKPDPAKESQHSELSNDITYQKAEREVASFRSCVMMPYYSSGSDFYGIKFDQYKDELCNRMILELKAVVATKKFEIKTVRFPANWKEGLRLAIRDGLRKIGWWELAAQWDKRRPINYTEVTMEASAYHPDIAIPDHQTFVNIVTTAKYNQHL